jgi:serine/threonine-protein kinase
MNVAAESDRPVPPGPAAVQSWSTTCPDHPAAAYRERTINKAATARSAIPPAHIPPGTIIGRKYRIDEFIAEGGMGIVYRGWHLALEQPVAIKVVLSEYADHPRVVARFLSEARLMAQMRGTHVARVLDTGYLEGGSPYLVLEYLVGRDLHAVLQADGPLPLGRAVEYVLQACEAMAEAHGLGIVHRDLKPGNLFLTQLPDGTEVLKVIDFGISMRLDAELCLTSQTQGLGSPQYMAPEQIASPDTVDARADIWSLGIVLFELLTNAVPFEAESADLTCYRILTEEPTPLAALRPDLSPELEALVRRCLCKCRDDRYASVQELAEALLPFAPEPCIESVRRVRGIFSSLHPQPGQVSAADVQREEDPESEPVTERRPVDTTSNQSHDPPPLGAPKNPWSGVPENAQCRDRCVKHDGIGTDSPPSGASRGR